MAGFFFKYNYLARRRRNVWESLRLREGEEKKVEMYEKMLKRVGQNGVQIR